MLIYLLACNQEPADVAAPGTVALESLAPLVQQAELRGGEHALLSGHVDDGCPGVVRVDAIALHGSPDEPPLATVELDPTGAFELAVPLHQPLALTAICDGDGDGLLGSRDDRVGSLLELGRVEGPQAELEVSWMPMAAESALAIGAPR